MKAQRNLCFLTTAASVFLSLGKLAVAQTTSKAGDFSVQRFEPAIGSSNYLSVESARMAGIWGWSVGLGFNYARDPFVVLSCRSQANCTDVSAINRQNLSVVRDLATWDLLAALNPISRVYFDSRTLPSPTFWMGALQ